MERSKFKSHSSLIGRSLKNAGDVIYHADTGVSEKNRWNKEKAHRIRKAMGPYRWNPKEKIGDGRTEKMYEIDDGISYAQKK